MDASEHKEDLSRIELFEALGHPVRVKILEALSESSLGFADLKRKVGIESSGHLVFHLGKLEGLISVDASGNYKLTDDGNEALKLISAIGESKKDTTISLKIFFGAFIGVGFSDFLLFAYSIYDNKVEWGYFYIGITMYLILILYFLYQESRRRKLNL